MEDEPPPKEEEEAGKAAKDEAGAGDEAGETEDDEGDGEPDGESGQAEKPRRKRRKKYDWDQANYEAQHEDAKKFAQEVARTYPDIGHVVVDRMGKVIGGVNPFEGNDAAPEDRQGEVDEEEFPELAGEIAGMDDPPDAPWRVEAEKIIREKVTKCGLRCYDILWTFHKLEVTVTRAAGDGPEEEASYVDSDKLMEAIRGVNAALEEREEELFVLGRHELIVATPGSKDILTTGREFEAFKGFDIIVKTGGPFEKKRELRGKLLERTFDELHITQSGRKVRIPLALVDEVRLPPAMVEPGDVYT